MKSSLIKHIILNSLLIFIMGSAFAFGSHTNNFVKAETIREKRRTTGFSEFNRPAYYKAMESADKSLVDAQLMVLNTAPVEVKNAFLGAMTMRKAGMGGNPVSKLKLFKKGRTMLEEAIQKEPDNAEYRFLRLIIQENAPGILGYKGDEEKDSAVIRKSYKSLPEQLQKTIAEYNKKSNVLKLQFS